MLKYNKNGVHAYIHCWINIKAGVNNGWKKKRFQKNYPMNLVKDFLSQIYLV